MQETSALYRQIMSTENHWFETRVVIGDSGDLVDNEGYRILFGGDAIVVARSGPESGFDEGTIKSVKTSLEMFGNEPVVGKAIAGEIELVMNKPAGEIPRMGVVIPYVRALGYQTNGSDAFISDNILYMQTHAAVVNNLLTFDDDSGVYISSSILTFVEATHELMVSEWLQQGKFYVDTRETTDDDDGLKILTVHGFDAMMLAEQDYVDSELSYGEAGTPNYGALDIDMVDEIAFKMGLSVDSRTYTLMNEGYRLPPPTSYCLREMLQIIASCYAGCFIISDAGELRLVTLDELPPETRYLIDSYGYVILFGGDRILV